MTVGEKIKQKRIELGWSQEELAKRCGYKSRSSINKIELARDLPLKKIEIMANVLGVTPAYLMGWEGQEKFDLGEHKDWYNEDIARKFLELKENGYALDMIRMFLQLSHPKQEIVMNLAHSLLLDEHPEQ